MYEYSAHNTDRAGSATVGAEWTCAGVAGRTPPGSNRTARQVGTRHVSLIRSSVSVVHCTELAERANRKSRRLLLACFRARTLRAWTDVCVHWRTVRMCPWVCACLHACVRVCVQLLQLCRYIVAQHWHAVQLDTDAKRQPDGALARIRMPRACSMKCD
jgi:hypothetical protein